MLARPSVYFHQMIDAISRHFHFDIYTPFKDLPNNIQDVLLHGSGNEEIEFYYEKGDRRHYYKKTFEGVLKNLERRYHETDSFDVRDDLTQYMNTQPCPICNGSRLKKEALFIKIGGSSINNITRLSIKECLKFYRALVFLLLSVWLQNVTQWPDDLNKFQELEISKRTP